MKITINPDQLAELTRLIVKGVETESRFDQPSASINEIECIKRVRGVTGLGLRDARQLVEAALPDHDPVAHVAWQICDPVEDVAR
jgi:Ribosomal protein L7/L12 C-terminal domain